jgi:ketosteroid isomerase-like protein
MTASEATRRVLTDYFAKAAAFDFADALALLSPDVVYTVHGSSFGGTYRGLEAVTTRLLPQVVARLTSPLAIRLRELIVEGERAVALVHGDATGAHGPYANEYAFVLTVRDGRITTVDEYLDTALVETALLGRTIGPPAGD